MPMKNSMCCVRWTIFYDSAAFEVDGSSFLLHENQLVDVHLGSYSSTRELLVMKNFNKNKYTDVASNSSNAKITA